MITIERATAPTDDVRALVGELEADLAAGYLPEQRHGLALEAIFEPHIRFFVARLHGVAVGCGGVALFKGFSRSEATRKSRGARGGASSGPLEREEDFAELKRMYVRPDARGRGVAEALVARIEACAREASLGRLCLETGDRQRAAMRFYERVGFTVCEVFGAYASMPAPNIATSVFFEKRLG